jgi:glutaredoxin
VSDLSNHPTQANKAVLYRMVMPEHVCPWGLKARDLLRRSDYEVEDHHLTTRAEVDTFKAKHGVASTPQVFIGGERVGGYEDLRRFLGKPVLDPKGTSYRPIVVLFTLTALAAVAATFAATGGLLTPRTVQWFIAFSMVVLAMLKLQNVEAFSAMFLNYDLLARRWVPYSYVYPYAEALAGLLMIAGALTWLSVPVALFIGTVGAASVFKAVYVEKRDLKCACVGGSSNVPLGFVSLTENLMMIGMALWMAAETISGM